ncbi:hypothetical protein [Nonomuraea sp. CA-141351]|uniref:acyl-CoA-like ligand-binding transcription factor n=1 Tax=Nonomuraea sp. CA-141351 TaxID=3239996 RepID=UPI003D92D63E
MRLMLPEPAVRGKLARGGAAEEVEFAAAIADRTDTGVDRDRYPRLVAATVSAAVRSATLRWVHADMPGLIAAQLKDAIRQPAAGLPVP